MKHSLHVVPMLALLLGPSIALADIAPSNSSIGSLSSSKRTSIQMTHEIVRFSIPAHLGVVNNHVPPSIHAYATFWLKNPTAKFVRQDVFFPVRFTEGGSGSEYQYAKNIRVIVNGARVATHATQGTYDVEVPGKKTAFGGTEMIFKKAKVDDGYAFHINVKSKATVRVVVSFDAPVGYNYYDQRQPTIIYLLASGAGWAGKIGQATIEFAYPMKARKNWVATIPENDMSTPTFVMAHGNMIQFIYKNFKPMANDAPTYAFLTAEQAKQHPKSKPATTRPSDGP